MINLKKSIKTVFSLFKINNTVPVGTKTLLSAVKWKSVTKFSTYKNEKTKNKRIDVTNILNLEVNLRAVCKIQHSAVQTFCWGKRLQYSN